MRPRVFTRLLPNALGLDVGITATNYGDSLLFPQGLTFPFGIYLKATVERTGVKLEHMVVMIIEIDRPAFALNTGAVFAQLKAE